MKNFSIHFMLRVLFGVLFLAYGADAQWLWQNPSPQGNNLNNLIFVDANTGYAVGEGCSILKTTDGGMNWSDLSLPDYPGYTLMDISFVDVSTGWITGYYLASDFSSVYGLVLKTTNAGATWTEQYNGFFKPTFGIQFFDALNGTVVGSDLSLGQGLILRTTDGGNTWLPQNSAFGGLLTSVYFSDANTGTIVNDGGNIQRTTDGGTSWNAQVSGTSELLTDVYFTDTNIGTVVGGNGTILRTTNGGGTWTAQNSGLSNQIEKVFFLDADHGWATTLGLIVGGNVLHTTDGGDTWTLQFTTTYGTNGLEGIYFNDSENGFLVGFHGLIYSTTDAGSSWAERSNHLTTEKLLDVCAVDQYTAYAAGTGEVLLKTTNGGDQWDFIASPGTENYSVDFLDANTGWIASNNGGNTGGVYKTTDGGINWIQQCLVNGNIRNLHHTDADHVWGCGYISGETPAVLKTTDGGNTWDSVAISAAGEKINSVCFVNNNTGWAVCGPVMGNTGGQLFKSTDGGAAWTEQTFPGTTPLNNIYFIDENTGWIVGGAAYGVGILLKTTDGGANWTSVPYGSADPLQDVEFLDSDNGTAVGSNGIIIATTNGGDAWESSAGISLIDYLHSISFSNENTGFIVGNSGVILKNNYVTPVELSSFTAGVINDKVMLTWSTSTETNNRGFDVERETAAGDEQSSWIKIGFVHGNGTSSKTHIYKYEDNPGTSGQYCYRLKQVDFSGSFEYSKIVEISFDRPKVYSLSQNYPNPFNPSTDINYSIPDDGFVRLNVYNVLGQEVAVLVNGVMKAGNHHVNFNSADLSSGVYYYRIEMNGHSLTKKMMLLR